MPILSMGKWRIYRNEFSYYYRNYKLEQLKTRTQVVTFLIDKYSSHLGGKSAENAQSYWSSTVTYS